MATVQLWSSLTRFTDGARAVEVPGATVAEALDNLVKAHPGLDPILRGGVSVVIDGEMIPNRHAEIAPDAELFLMQRLKGG